MNHDTCLIISLVSGHILYTYIIKMKIDQNNQSRLHWISHQNLLLALKVEIKIFPGVFLVHPSSASYITYYLVCVDNRNYDIFFYALGSY